MAKLFELPRYIAVEGPIRVGKSTLARALAGKMGLVLFELDRMEVPLFKQGIEGDAIGSAVQVGSPRAHQAVSVSHLNLDTVREIVDVFEAQAASLRLPDGDTRQLRADMAAAKVQTGLPTPDHRTIAGHLQSARTILEHATDRAAAAGLLDLLRNLQL